MSPRPNQGLTLAAAVRERRVYLGLTQRQLSEASGIDQPTICRIEAGRRPGKPTIDALERVLGPGLPRKFRRGG